MNRLKSQGRSMLPKGMATFFPEATAFRRGLERSAFEVFRSWGYEEVITPLFEYLDVIAPGLGPGLLEKAYTVTDRTSGRVMVLRPDMTPQVARMAGMLLGDAPRPLRLCYGANVFRYEDEHAGHEREIFQLGAELVGPSVPAADVEIVALAVEVLERFGLGQTVVSIGHVGFFKGWLAETRATTERATLLEEAVIKKDRMQVEALLAEDGHTASDARRLAELVDLIGGEEILDRAERVVTHSVSRESLVHLREVIRLARAYGLTQSIVLDLAEIRSRNYYSGMVFELFAAGVGYEIGRGGRYDDLIGRFGPECPSTGFAIHLERLQQALAVAPSVASYGAADVLAVGAANGPAGSAMVGRFRRRGVRVAMWLDESVEDVAVNYARARNIPWLLMSGPGSRVTLTDVRTLRARRLSPSSAASVILAKRASRKDNGR